MERVIPPWGLYRLFSALEKKGASGLLTLHFPDGAVSFTIRGGLVVDCRTDVDGLSFPEFLFQSGMVQDRKTAESFSSVQQLVDANIIRAADSTRFHIGYVKGIVDIILPAPVQSWTFDTGPDAARPPEDAGVDMCAELFTAVQRFEDLDAMRTVVGRLGTIARISEGASGQCVAHAKAMFKGAALVKELAGGRCPPISQGLLSNDDNLRILFGFVVTGALVSASSGAGPLSDVPVSAVSTKSPDVDFDEFRVPGSASATSRYEPVPHQEGAPHREPAGRQETPVEDALDLAVVPDVRIRASNFQRDDYLVMDDNGTIKGFTSAGSVSREMRRDALLVDPELDRAIKAELARAAALSHYELLEIAPDARVSAVRMAVLRARRRYSPSRYEGGVTPESMKELLAVIERIGKIGEIFSDLNLRVAYNRSQNISTPGLEAQLAAIFEARGHWRQGMQLLEDRKATEALEMFEAAENCDAEEPDYFCAQGFALLAMAPAQDTYETIESLLDVAFSFDPDLVTAHLLAADYNVRKNDFDAAQGHIRKVLALDPESREARAFRLKTKASRAAGQVSFKKKQESLLQKAIKLIRR